jgi:hypothetical protein
VTWFQAQVHASQLHASHAATSLPIAALAVIGVCLGVLVFSVLCVVVPRGRHTLRAHGAGWRRTHDAATAEARARAMMSELCPHGWQAEITLISEPADTVVAGAPLVAVDWSAFRPDPKSEPLIRRVWAPTIAEALDAMVADRATDATLEEIERAAAADGIAWSDP